MRARVLAALVVAVRAAEYRKIHGDDPSIYDGQAVMSETDRVARFHELHGEWPDSRWLARETPGYSKVRARGPTRTRARRSLGRGARRARASLVPPSSLQAHGRARGGHHGQRDELAGALGSVDVPRAGAHAADLHAHAVGPHEGAGARPPPPVRAVPRTPRHGDAREHVAGPFRRARTDPRALLRAGAAPHRSCSLSRSRPRATISRAMRSRTLARARRRS